MDFKIVSGKLKEPMRLVVYGKDGVGKTEFASQAPKPVFICAERGTGHLAVNRLPSPKDFTDIENQTKWLLEHPEHETVIFDSLDWLEPMLFKRCEVELKKELSQIGYNKGYEYAIAKMRDFIALVSQLKQNVIVIAHAKIKTFQDPGLSSGYDRYQIATARDEISNIWRQWGDAVLFFDYKSYKKDDEDRFAQGEGKRVMYTEERPSHQAKNRFSLPYELPLEKGKGWATFMAAVNAGGSDPKILAREVMDLLDVIKDEKKRADSVTYVGNISDNPSLLQEFKAKLLAIKNGGI